MISVPGIGLLSFKEQELFAQEFEKDLKFFQLMLLLINKSCPLKNVHLIWAEDGPGTIVGRAGVRHTGTTQALTTPYSRHLRCQQDNLSPSFCNVVSGFGQHETESCGTSDRAAEQRVRTSGKPQVYRCHAGLVDIAVPVICEGEHIATLFSGQVLEKPATKKGLVQIRKNVKALAYIDKKELEEACWKVPTVTEQDIQDTVRILESFSDHLATAWKRLSEAVKTQRLKQRELQLARNEFAHIVLNGHVGSRERLHNMLRKLGFNRPPNRAIVVKLEADTEEAARSVSSDLELTAALHAIEEFVRKRRNVAVAYLRHRGVCLFFCDTILGLNHSSELRVCSFAAKLRNQIARRCKARVRIGIGGLKDWVNLCDSYHEACVALTESSEGIAVFTKVSWKSNRIWDQVQTLTQCIVEGRQQDAKYALMSLPLLVAQQGWQVFEALPKQRQFFAAALESILLAAQEQGADRTALEDLRHDGSHRFERATGTSDLQMAILCLAEGAFLEIQRCNGGRHQKMVNRACYIIEGCLKSSTPNQVSMEKVSSQLGVSTGHLSRTFRRVTGVTFENHLTYKRIELAKRKLLDPMSHITEVAARSGFSSASYFARTFRKVVGCSPSAYVKNPAQFLEHANGQLAIPGEKLRPS